MRIRTLVGASVALAAFAASVSARAQSPAPQAAAPQAEVTQALEARADAPKADTSAYGVRMRIDGVPTSHFKQLGLFSKAAPSAPAAGAAGPQAQSGLVNFNSLAFSDAFQTVTPFSGGMMTRFGPVSASGYRVVTSAPYLIYGDYFGQDRTHYDLRDFSLTAAVAPGLAINAGYNLDLAGRFNGYDVAGSRAYDGLFFSASALNSPYLRLTDGGDFLGATVQLTNDLRLHFGASALDPQRARFDDPLHFGILAPLQGAQAYRRGARAAEAGLTWDFAKWGGLGLTASSTREHGGILGNVDSNALSAAKSADTTAVGLSARFGFGKGWVTTFSYSEGITQLNLRPNSVAAAASRDSLHSRSYGVAVAKHGLFGDNDLLGVAVSRPIQVYGNVDLASAVGLAPHGNPALGRGRVSLAGKTPETDVELGYVTTFFDGALALQANAGYQMNFAGQSGTNALTVLSRAKINF